MNKIIAKKYLSDNLVKFEIKVSTAIREIKPGQYVIFRIEENGPGVPLTVSKVNTEKESITVFVPITDIDTRQLADINAESNLFRIDGPFGVPLKTENFGTVLCMGCGSGIVPLLPVLTSLRASGNRIVTVLSAQSKEGIVLENEIGAASDELLILTEDGSWGEKGSICHVLRKILTDSKIMQVFAFGSAKMIKESYSLTRKYNIPMQAVLYLGKVDECGLNSIFRVNICRDGKSVCVDGINLNAYYNDIEEMVRRFESKAGEENHCVEVLHEANISV